MFHDAHKVDFKGWCQSKSDLTQQQYWVYPCYTLTLLNLLNSLKRSTVLNCFEGKRNSTGHKFIETLNESAGFAYHNASWKHWQMGFSTASQPLLVGLPLRPFPGLINSFGSIASDKGLFWSKFGLYTPLMFTLPILNQPSLTFNMVSKA